MKFYSTKEISCMTGINVKTIQKLIRDRLLPAIRLSGRYLVKDEDFKEFLKKRIV